MKVFVLDAYKHVKVRAEDVRLQYVKIGGRYLVDTALTFGASSSPGIFDRLAELVLKLALHLAKLSRELAVRQLDDNVLIGEPAEVWGGYFAFHSLAKKIGVRTSVCRIINSPEAAHNKLGSRQSVRGLLTARLFSFSSWSNLDLAGGGVRAGLVIPLIS